MEPGRVERAPRAHHRDGAAKGHAEEQRLRLLLQHVGKARTHTWLLRVNDSQGLVREGLLLTLARVRRDQSVRPGAGCSRAAAEAENGRQPEDSAHGRVRLRGAVVAELDCPPPG